MPSYEQVVDFWQSKSIGNDANMLAAIMDERAVSFAYNSCKIENPNVTYDDTREMFDKDRVVNYTGDLRTIFEIRNAKYANDLFLKAFAMPWKNMMIQLK